MELSPKDKEKIHEALHMQKQHAFFCLNGGVVIKGKEGCTFC
jgi:hypothetical protein